MTMMVYKKGSKGEIVKQIQKALNLYPDGIFGSITEEAVKAFQKKHGLTVDGIVGAATWARLIPKVVFPSMKPKTVVGGYKKSKRTINELIVHCSDSPEGRNDTVDDIRRWHTMPPPKGNGWSDIGYHYVIHLDGSVHVGRDVDLIGAHCSKGGHNTYSIGICYVGGKDNQAGFPKDTRTDAQKAALMSLLIDLKKLYPKAKIYGHRDFDKGKACPSFNAKKEYEKV